MATRFYAYLPGGASGGILPASMDDIPLDFDTLQPYGCFIGSAAVMVLSNHDTAMDAARNMMRFFERRVLRPVHAVPRRHRQGARADRAAAWDLPLLADLSQVMRDASICGLGQAAPNPVDCVVKYFPHEAEVSHERHHPQPNRPARRARRRVHAQRPARRRRRANETLIEVADREGIEIPRLCYKPGLDTGRQLPRLHGRDRGRARAGAVLLPHPDRRHEGHHRQRARDAVRSSMVLELLQSDMPESAATRATTSSTQWAGELAVGKPRFAPRARVAPDLSHPAIAVNLDACIQCTRCLRACRDEQINDVIGLALRGDAEKIVFDMDDPMGNSTCVACGECVQACPTGALMPARDAGADAVPDSRSIRSARIAASAAS